MKQRIDFIIKTIYDGDLNLKNCQQRLIEADIVLDIHQAQVLYTQEVERRETSRKEANK